MKDDLPISPELFDEMHELVSAFLAGDRSSVRKDRLQELIRQDLGACDLYLNMVFESSMLMDWAANGDPSEADPANSQAVAPPPLACSTIPWAATSVLSSSWPIAYLIATMIFAIGGLIGAYVHVSQPGWSAHQPTEIAAEHFRPAKQTSSVARLTAMVDCRWHASSDVRAMGRVVAGERVALISGLIEITYDTGARVVLHGPVRYEVESSNGGFLSMGELAGRVEAEPARGFVVHTPTAAVTDLGTEFSVNVDGSGVTISHVFRGSVKVTELSNREGTARQVVVLRQDETARAGKRGERIEISLLDRRKDSVPNLFTRFEELQRVSGRREPPPAERWPECSRRLRTDPALLTYYTFEPHPFGNGVVPNLSPLGTLLNGRVTSAEWVAGRLPNKLALCFHGPDSGDKLMLPEQERFNFSGPFSVAVWFKASRITDRYQQLVTKGDRTWRLQTGIGDLQSRSPVVTLAWNTDSDMEGETRTDVMLGRTNIADGKWHFAVGVCEPVGKTLHKRLYVDGRLDRKCEAPGPVHRDDQPVWIGSNNDTSVSPTAREFDGLIDEVAIFSRSLSADEVAAMFRAGVKP